MEIEKTKAIVEKLGNEFDSHSFIRKLLEMCPNVYGELLMKYNDVTIVDAQIAIFLLNNALELTCFKKQFILNNIQVFQGKIFTFILFHITPPNSKCTPLSCGYYIIFFL